MNEKGNQSDCYQRFYCYWGRFSAINVEFSTRIGKKGIKRENLPIKLIYVKSNSKWIYQTRSVY
ncbi:hypothetical protein GCM10027592_20380 [Spirosoma flavus]